MQEYDFVCEECGETSRYSDKCLYCESTTKKDLTFFLMVTIVILAVLVIIFM